MWQWNMKLYVSVTLSMIVLACCLVALLACYLLLSLVVSCCLVALLVLPCWLIALLPCN
jgi:hypothetical protein